MTPPEEWSPEALSLLDSLWGEHASMLVVRRRLHPLLGFYPSPEQVMAMVKRPREPVAETIPQPRTMFEKVLTRRIERFGFGPPIREDNVVKLVKPKTHPAPTGGFTMFGGKK